MDFHPPYLLFFGDVTDTQHAKTGLGLHHWAPERCLAEYRLPGCTVSAGLPSMTPAEAAERGARAFVIGVANTGGLIPEAWHGPIVEALEAGLDVVNGLHTRLRSIPAVTEAALRTGQQLIDVREAPPDLFRTNTARPRTGRRLLTVGTDCAIGKMFTALALTQALEARGANATFRATGQTGILIAGRGVAVDAVVADFIAGAAEWLSPPAADDHWDVVEGQGSLYHPAYAGVTVGLVHGTQPTHLVLCHDPSRAHIRGFPRQTWPALPEVVEDYLRLARLTSPDVQMVGVSLNTRTLSDADAEEALRETAHALGLPCVDPVRTGVDALADALLGAAAPVGR